MINMVMKTTKKHEIDGHREEFGEVEKTKDDENAQKENNERDDEPKETEEGKI